ncbi:MAG: hypothetical protein CVU05_08945 [Bacteroidetes bacterium HGW-Bacteroidetes-21]|jgi:hypothetical protein|nr:MAG: hypothetical protein CVU05_08945 [Bacteroidetes bacterium HGW-Bacteroidetes-21]
MRIIILFIFIFLSGYLMSQDTIVLLSGDEIPVQSYKVNTSDNLIDFVNKRGKNKLIETDFVFCVKKSNGEEDLIYFDSVIEYDSISIGEMRSYVEGAMIARKKYHAPLATISGFVVGAGSVFLFPEVGLPVFYSPVLPGAYSAVIGSLNPNQNKIIEKYPDRKENPYFLKGYSEMARQKRINNVVKGSIAGIVAMIVTAIIIN